MKNIHIRTLIALIGIIAGLALSNPVWATAPRFAPKMFEKDKTQQIEIYACDFPPYLSLNLPSGGVHAEIIQAVFKEIGMEIEMKILPVKSLVEYALTQDNAVAILGYDWQSSAEERQNEIWIPFAMINIKVWDKPVPIIFNKKNEQGLALAKQFRDGLIKMQENGSYLQILKKYYGEQDSLELFMQNLQTQQKEAEKQQEEVDHAHQ